MNKEFVPYEEALALKELGFNEPCLAFYNHKNLSCAFDYLNGGFKNFDENVAAPLYQQAFRWFREKYGLYCGFVETKTIKIRWEHNSFETVVGETDEQAELECLRKLIEIVKDKK